MNTTASQPLPDRARTRRTFHPVLRLQSRIILLALLCTLTPAPCREDPRTSLKIDIGAIDRAVTGQMKQQQMAGTAVGVVLGGKVILTKGYGYANLESAQPVTVESVFNWASNSKPLMAVAAMQLVQQGLLDLDADVRRYVPEFPEQKHIIKVRHLLCHQSGIPHYSNGRVIPLSSELPSPNAALDPVAALNVFARSPLLFVPGENYSYSTYAYILLSAVVQRAGRLPIAEQLKKRIMAPLKMSSFQLDLAFSRQTNWVLAYQADAGGKHTRVPDEAHFWKHGGGGYKSNIRDFCQVGGGLAQLKAGGSENRATDVDHSADEGWQTGVLWFGVQG